MKIELGDEEVKVLAGALESYLSELSTEIGHTDSRDFRAGLKEQRDVLQRILQALRPDHD